MNLMEVHAREKAGAPEAWCLYSWSIHPTPPEKALYIEIKGAVAPLKTKGKDKGYPNFRKLDKSTERTVIITPQEHETWLAAWERSTGKCSECAGAGKVFKSWHHITGTEYRTCRKCAGSGAAKQPTEATS